MSILPTGAADQSKDTRRILEAFGFEDDGSCEAGSPGILMICNKDRVQNGAIQAQLGW